MRSDFKGQNLDVTYALPVNHYIHVDFFPEGGQCINGLKSNMAFKAVTRDGKPVEIEGNIIDQNGLSGGYSGLGT